MREIFTVQEAAEMLDVHRVTLGRWLREGRVAGVKLSNVWRIEAAEMRRVRLEGVPRLAGSKEDTTQ